MDGGERERERERRRMKGRSEDIGNRGEKRKKEKERGGGEQQQREREKLQCEGLKGEKHFKDDVRNEHVWYEDEHAVIRRAAEPA